MSKVVLTVDVLEKYAMSLWLRHASSTIVNITPNQKTGLENNIITVVNWCKQQRLSSPSQEILGVAEELYKMLNAQVELLLDKLEGKAPTPLPIFSTKQSKKNDNLLDDRSEESKEFDDEELDLTWLDEDDDEDDGNLQSQLVEPQAPVPDSDHIRQKQLASLVQESFTTFVFEFRAHLNHVPKQRRTMFIHEFHNKTQGKEKAVQVFILARLYTLLLNCITKYVAKTIRSINKLFVMDPTLKQYLLYCYRLTKFDLDRLEKLFQVKYLLVKKNEPNIDEVKLADDVLCSLTSMIDEIQECIDEILRRYFEYFVKTTKCLLQCSEVYFIERGIIDSRPLKRELIGFWREYLKPFLLKDLHETVAYPFTILELNRHVKQFEQIADKSYGNIFVSHE